MNNILDNFDPISEKEWKNKVQVELKGLDYNETLVWGTSDQINVKPVYSKNDIDYSSVKPLPKTSTDWKIISNYSENEAMDYSYLYGYDIKYSTLENQPYLPDYLDLFVSLEQENYTKNFENLKNLKNLVYLNYDIFGYYAQNGLWPTDDYKQAIAVTKNLIENYNFEKLIAIQADVYQNAGANHVQQLAITLAHGVEYLEHFGKEIADKIFFKFAVGSNYFFEIAKLRAFRFLWQLVLDKYNYSSEAYLYTTTSLRNKSKLDKYNNVIRTTIEANAAILGGSNAINVKAFDELTGETDFGIELAAKQQLLLQKESYLDQFNDPVAGSYYIESLTNQMAENALELFKTIQEFGGFIKGLENETIQDIIYNNAKKEQKEFDANEINLIGVNKFRNKEEILEKTKKEKIVKQALFVPIVPSRLADKIES